LGKLDVTGTDWQLRPKMGHTPWAQAQSSVHIRRSSWAAISAVSHNAAELDMLWSGLSLLPRSPVATEMAHFTKFRAHIYTFLFLARMNTLTNILPTPLADEVNRESNSEPSQRCPVNTYWKIQPGMQRRITNPNRKDYHVYDFKRPP
jgi:hypothetical protein